MPQQRPSEKRWCLPKTGADSDALQRNIDYVCGLGLDCGPIQEGGSCFEPDTVRAHAAYVMNAYYRANGKNDYDCDFEGTGSITNVDPSEFVSLISCNCISSLKTFCWFVKPTRSSSSRMVI